MITTNDIGTQVRVVTFPGHTYTLTWVSQAPQYVGSRQVLWCGVIPDWSRTPENPEGLEYTVNVANVRRMPNGE